MQYFEDSSSDIKKMKTYKHKPSAATQTSLPCIVIHLLKFKHSALLVSIKSSVHYRRKMTSMRCLCT